MFLFWMTTMVCTTSPGRGEGLRAERRDHLAVAAFADREDIDVQIVAGSLRNSMVFSSCSSKP
jgi:hypothetical protein